MNIGGSIIGFLALMVVIGLLFIGLDMLGALLSWLERKV